MTEDEMVGWHHEFEEALGTMTRRNSTSEHPPLVSFRATGSGPTLPFWGLRAIRVLSPASPGPSGV